jgi:hypothetical protein
MSGSRPANRKRGRPRTAPETHRRVVSVRLRPSLLERLEAAAAEAEHSLSREIERRCDAFETLDPTEPIVTRLTSLEDAVERLISATKVPSWRNTAAAMEAAQTSIPSDQTLVESYISETLASGRIPRKQECQGRTGLSYPRVSRWWPDNLPEPRGRRTKERRQ